MTNPTDRPDQLVVEADGGSRGNPGPAAYGALVRDGRTGRIIVELAEYLGATTNNVAEYSGLVAGLEAAAQINPQATVTARLDSKLVVEQMSGRWAIRNAVLRPIALRAKALATPDRVSMQWVPRAQNKRADALVNECLDAVAAGRPGSIRRWLDVDPGDILADAGEQVGGAARRAAAEEAQGRPAKGDARAGAAAVRAAATPQPNGPEEVPAGTPAAGEELAGVVPNRIVGWADLDEPTRLLVVRHGVTRHSVEHRFSGRGGIDPPLLPLGQQQAQAVAEELAQRGGAQAVVTSPMTRARQTAGIIAKRLGLGRPVVVDDLAEADFGRWDGLTFAEVRHRWPDELTAWLSSPEVAPPGGESFAAMRVRVDRARAELVAAHPSQRVIVVAHVSPIKALVQRVLEAPAVSAFRIELAPCSLTTIGWWSDGGCTIYGVGEVGHLRDTLHPTA